MIFFFNTEDISWHRRNPGHDQEWYVCPQCFWVSLAYRPNNRPTPPMCPRVEGDLVGMLGAGLFGTRKPCGNSAWIKDLAPRVHAAMDGAFRMGGINAVIQLLEQRMPIELGLDHPAIDVQSPRSFAELRPSSVRPKRKR